MQRSTYIIREGYGTVAPSPELQPQPQAANFHFPIGRGVWPDGFNLRVSMPAVLEKDFAFRIDERGLLLFGTRREPPEFGQSKTFALRYGEFQQRINFPSRVDTSKVKVRFHHGVLDIHISFVAVAVRLPSTLRRRIEEVAVACAAS